jgi:hypothetical protein
MGDVRFLKNQHSTQGYGQWEKLHTKRFEHFLNSGYLSDTEILVGTGDHDHKESFKVHKLIIAIGSPLLYEVVTHSPESRVELDNIEPDIFRLFLKVNLFS